MADPPPGEPVVFMKPPTSLVREGQTLSRPEHGRVLHHEAEVVVLIGLAGKNIPENEASRWVAGLALGLDLTLRDVQSSMKQKGLPWEMAKSFDGSAPVGPFIPYSSAMDLSAISFQCSVDDQPRQQGRTSDMLYSISYLIHFLSGIWALQQGDLVYTGTPSGVGLLEAGNRVRLESEILPACEWTVA
jgi:2-keto-4-pentenoate hydratase/2-oxohepta-3-ene-1,7-dioic acid hydratase in catechol pathway